MAEKEIEKVEIPGPLKVLFICAFADGIALGFIMPLSVLFYQDRFGTEPVEIGFIVSSSGFVGLMASWVAGWVSDRLGRKPVITLGMLSSRLSGMVIPFTLDLRQATPFLAIRSLGFNVSNPAMHALRADIVPQKARARLFGLYNTFLSAGDIVGPVIATYLYDLYRFRTFEIGFHLTRIRDTILRELVDWTNVPSDTSDLRKRTQKGPCHVNLLLRKNCGKPFYITD